jgi:hypothetical protein
MPEATLHAIAQSVTYNQVLPLPPCRAVRTTSAWLGAVSFDGTAPGVFAPAGRSRPSKLEH